MKNLLNELTPIIEILDIGAMNLGENTEDYLSLIKKDLCNVIGFEPVKNECNKLNKLYGGKYKFLPYCIGNGEAGKFYQTNFPMNCSLYEPNKELLELFQNLGILIEVESVKNIRTKRLEDIEELPADIDYLKIDIQGGELDVFKHAGRVLDQVVLIHTEVEFVPLYKNQPLFADVDLFLRSKGFQFHKFLPIFGRSFIPFLANNDPNFTISQQLWADAVYVKDFMHLDKLVPEKLLKLAVILHEVYRSYDLCHFVLSEYDRQKGSAFADKYLHMLGKPQ